MARGKRHTGPRSYLRCANCRAPIPMNYRICSQCGFNNSSENRREAIKAWNKHLGVDANADKGK